VPAKIETQRTLFSVKKNGTGWNDVSFSNKSLSVRSACVARFWQSHLPISRTFSVREGDEAAFPGISRQPKAAALHPPAPLALVRLLPDREPGTDRSLRPIGERASASRGFLQPLDLLE
jgi:hypothetical protein